MDWELELTQKEFTELKLMLTQGTLEEDTELHYSDHIVVWLRESGGSVYEKTANSNKFHLVGVASTPAQLHELFEE